MAGFNRGNVLSEMKDWLASARNQSFQRDKRIDGIRTILDSPTQVRTDQGKSFVGSHLGILSNWYLTLGTVSVLEDDGKGWGLLNLGMQTDYWHIRILVKQWELDARATRQPRVGLSRAALCLGLAMGLGEKDAATWLGERLLKSVSDGALGQWGLSHLPGFMARLYCRLIAQQAPIAISVVSAQPDPYQGILDCWTDGDLSEAIELSCDYHVQASRDTVDGGVGDFARYPFNILPVEIWALRAVRRALGQATPDVRHPLLAPPLDRVPDQIPTVEHELLKRAGALG